MKMTLMTLLLMSSQVFAAIKMEKVIYEKNGVNMVGMLAYNDSVRKPLPGILVFHDWMGNGAYSEMRAKQLAELGYVAFAADIYGQGVRPKDANEAATLAKSYRDNRKLLRERAQAGLEVLMKEKRVDKDKIAALGYCFGGTTALELARDGAPIKGVISFHGGLSTNMKAEKMSPKVLALHGADDPYVPKAEVQGFEDEMRAVKADWQLIEYGNSVHAFTQKDAGNDNSKGAAYNELADKRSWEAMKTFLKETL